MVRQAHQEGIWRREGRSVQNTGQVTSPLKSATERIFTTGHPASRNFRAKGVSKVTPGTRLRDP